jgi:hypothetical protein
MDIECLLSNEEAEIETAWGHMSVRRLCHPFSVYLKVF